MSGLLSAAPAKFNVPGLAVAATTSTHLIAVGTAGVREIGQPKPIGIDDRFHLGSCTKRMTGLMVLRLIDHHKLRLNETLSEALPGMPMRTVYRRVTVAQLLEFKGGIQPYLLIDPSRTPEVFSTQGTPEEQRRRFVAHVLSEPPSSQPGTKAVYSNACYAVLGYVASRATGKTWEQLMAENVFRPLGMASAGFGRPYSQNSPNQPRGHMLFNRRLAPEPVGFVHPASLSAAGDVSASMPDFANFAAEELRIAEGKSRLLSKSTAALLNRITPVGEGRSLLGGAGAFTASMTVWPSRDFAVVAAVNSGGGEAGCRELPQALKRTLVDGKPFSLAAASKPKSYGFMLNLDESGNVIIGGVLPGSLAAQAGISEGDQIVEMNGVPIEKVPDDQRFAALRRPNLALKLKRKDRLIDVNMQLPQ